MTIDINTLFFAIIIIGIVIACILTIVGMGVDSSLLYWAGGYGINSVAYVLIFLRGLIPDIASVWLANVMTVTTYALFAYGLLKFLNRHLNPLLIWTPVIVIAVVYPFLMSNVEARIALVGFMTAAQSLLLASLMISSTSHLIGRGKYILVTGFLLGVAVALSRPLTIILGLGEISAFNSPGVSQTITYVALAGLHVALALGLVLMQKEHAEAATDSIARSDDLTGLPNRRRLYERINQILTQKDSAREYGALMLIDLDNFKPLNDQYGHAMGDELLRQAARRISDCTASKDTTARLGGDEFVVLLTELGHQRDAAMSVAMQTADHIREKLAVPYNLRDELHQEAAEIHHRCSGSIGVVIIEPDMSDREALMRIADRAMYQAKNHSRGTISLSPLDLSPIAGPLSSITLPSGSGK